MSSKKVTFSDIADYTHFSKTTISRYFNNPEYLTPENRKIIKDALKALNYQENKIGRILAKGETELIGLIMPPMYMPYYSDVFQSILNQYTDFGYKFIVLSGDSNKSREETYIRELLSYNIEGLIILSHTLPSSDLAALGVPVVTIEREDQFISSVNSDNLMGGIQAASLLYRNQCDAYFFIDIPVYPETPAYNRLVGFQTVCRDKNLPNELYIQELGSGIENNYQNIGRIIDAIEMRHSDQKVGIFCANDTFAVLVEKYYFQRYHILGRHYCLVGYDNSSIATEAIVPFSSVGQQTDVIARETMEMLIGQIKKRRKDPECPLPVEHKVVTPILQRRDIPLPEIY